MSITKTSGAARPLKISALAELGGVPIATVKHYLREGLLPEPVKRTGRNMSWYDPACVDRLRAIKRMQQERFLPLKVIKEVLEMVGDDIDDLTTAAALSHFVERTSSKATRTRAELLASGVKPQDLDWLRRTGLVSPHGRADEEVYGGDDLALLRLLNAARRVGLGPEMLPTSILDDYARTIRELVRTELRIFRAGVIPQAGDRLSELADHAASLSEQLVVLVRRKMLLPTLEQMLAEARLQGRAKTAPQRRQRKATARAEAGTRPKRAVTGRESHAKPRTTKLSSGSRRRPR